MSTSIVLCGGGVYGALLLGALEQKGYENIRMIAGTSAGAIIGTLMCVGYSPRDILEAFQSNLPLLCDIDIKLLFTRYGLYDKRKYLGLVERMLRERTVLPPNPTFKDVYDSFGKDLVITGTNLSAGTTLYFNRVDYPNMPVLHAIDISTCVPLVFPHAALGNDVCVDGALTDGLPTRFAKEFAKAHIEEEQTFRVFNIRYAFGLSPDSLVNFVVCVLALFANKESETGSYELVADTLVSLTTSDPNALQRLFDSGYSQCASY